MAFGGPRSSCVRPGAHSAQLQDSHKDLTPCRTAWPFVSAGAHAPHSDSRSPYAFAGVVALRSSLTLPRFPGLLHCASPLGYPEKFKYPCGTRMPRQLSSTPVL